MRAIEKLPFRPLKKVAAVPLMPEAHRYTQGRHSNLTCGTIIRGRPEGGAHVAPNPEARIASLYHTPSPYTLVIDGKSHRVYGAELASVCAIREQILFSLTPEPEN